MRRGTLSWERALRHDAFTVKCIKRSFYTRRDMFPNPATPAIMSLYPHSAVYHSHPRMRTSCLLYWSYNLGSEWGICTVNITWLCGCVERKDTQTGIQAISFIIISKRRPCHSGIKQGGGGIRPRVLAGEITSLRRDAGMANMKGTPSSRSSISTTSSSGSSTSET